MTHKTYLWALETNYSCFCQAAVLLPAQNVRIYTLVPLVLYLLLLCHFVFSVQIIWVCLFFSPFLSIYWALRGTEKHSWWSLQALAPCDKSLAGSGCVLLSHRDPRGESVGSESPSLVSWSEKFSQMRRSWVWPFIWETNLLEVLFNREAGGGRTSRSLRFYLSTTWGNTTYLLRYNECWCVDIFHSSHRH